MPHTRYYLVLDGAVAGPYSLVALQQMASVNAFTADTLIAAEDSGGSEAWLPIHALPELSSALFPTAARHQLKPKEITFTTDAKDPVSVEALLRGNLDADAPRGATHPTPLPARPLGRDRRRDFLVALICANGLGLAVFAILPRSLYTDVPLLTYFVMSNIGLYWIYYHVMDRY
jgi:hypothetical protein